MIAFVGLGNPGRTYEKTKHNAGFWVVDEVARREKTNFKPGFGNYLYAISGNREILLVKPTTGMNNSGTAVKDIKSTWKIDLKDLYLIFDDLDLPLGKLRLRPKGGEGSHRGVESVIYQLGSTHFPRLRFGIATSDTMRPAEEYVLKTFRKKDQIIAAESITAAAEVLDSVVRRGLEQTMNVINR
ncbi:MAG: aminoacyl-tRNA hydrolase [Candidatus Neomarinimicrobiota bacterium]